MFKSPFIILALGLTCLASAAHGADAVKLDGITEPFHDVTLGLADPGIIRQQFFHEGDLAKKGEAILELDSKLEKLEVTRREAVMKQDKTIMDATRQLFKSTKSVSQQSLDKAVADYDVAKAQYAIAVQQLADRKLVAPFTGRITQFLLHPGAASAPYQPLVRLVDTSRCYFVGHIDGVKASNLQLNEPVTIKVDGGQTVTGKICFISPVVDAASGLARVKAVFNNPGDKIRPGLAATMVIQ